MPQEKFKREAARKSSISEILSGSFVESVEGQALSINGTPIKKVNILATVVDKSQEQSGAYRSMVIDDGTGQIQLRFFDSEGGDGFEKQEIGNLSLTIGKPRNYGNQTYITPEIIRKISDVKWAEVRRLELKAMNRPGSKPIAEKNADAGYPEKDIASKEKMQIYAMIKQLDKGNGADLSEVTTSSKSPNAEATIREMLKSGDLFEFLPGKLKVLE